MSVSVFRKTSLSDHQGANLAVTTSLGWVCSPFTVGDISELTGALLGSPHTPHSEADRVSFDLRFPIAESRRLNP